MAYVPFSLRYRPQTFDEIVGQDHVARTLQNALTGGRVVHAYLFAGPRGTGKTSTARVLAKALLCEHGPTPNPCNECRLCQAIAAGRALDVLEIDAASNRGIEQIRDLREKVRYAPAEARHKVYILDEVHMLTSEAFNALLKTLEEPPEHTFFVLATTELHKVPATIVSRCQLFEFHLMGERTITESLRAIATREGVEVDDDALLEIARAARGALRDAESVFDQIVAYADGPITAGLAREVLGATSRDALVGLLDAVASSDLAAVFQRLDDLVAGGKDLAQLLQDVTLAVREMLRLALGVRATAEWAELSDHARRLGGDRLAEGLKLLGDAERRLRDATQQQLALELALAEMTELWAKPSARDEARAAADRVRAQHPEPGPRVAGHPEPPPVHRPVEWPAPAPAPSPAPRPAPPAPVEPEPTPVYEAAPEVEPEPEPSPEPVAASESASSESVPASSLASAADLVERWGELHFQLKRMKRVSVWALLKEAHPVGMVGDEVILEFPGKMKFHHDRIASEYREDVERALSAVLGRTVTLRTSLTPTLAASDAARATTARAAAQHPEPRSRGSKPSAKPAPEPVEAPEPLASAPEPAPEPERQLVTEPEPEPVPEPTPEPPTPRSAEEAADNAASLALDLFEGSEEVNPE